MIYFFIKVNVIFLERIETKNESISQHTNK